MLTKAYVLDLFERALKTAAQALVAFLGVGTGILDVDWRAALIATGVAAGMSVLTSLASLRTDGEGTASAVPNIVSRFVVGDHR